MAKNSLQLYRTQIGPGQVRLYLGQKWLRSYPVPAGSRPLTLLLPGKLVIAGNDRRGKSSVQIFDLENNRLLTEKMGVGTVYQLYSRANTLFIKLSGSGAGISSFTLAQSLTSKSSAIISGWLVAEGGSSLLFDGTDAVYNPYEPVLLRYSRFDLATEHVVPLALEVPARRGCGLVDRNNLKGENDVLTYQQIIATRHDRCGIFQATFDWTLGNRQRPVVTPIR